MIGLDRLDGRASNVDSVPTDETLRTLSSLLSCEASQSWQDSYWTCPLLQNDACAGSSRCDDWVCAEGILVEDAVSSTGPTCAVTH